MATPQEKLADSLEALEALQAKGVVAVRSSDLSRTDRERLLQNGFLKEVMKGWYMPARPEERTGESTAWYASFWDFCAAYLEERFADQWCLSPEQSLFLHVGQQTVPRQLLVRAPKGRNNATSLPHSTSLFELRAELPPDGSRETLHGLRTYTLAAALVHSGAPLFAENAADARTALAMVRDSSDVLAILLEGGHSTIAGRVAGAFRNIGRDGIADEIMRTMKSASFAVRETDPFAKPAPFTFAARESSPCVTRARLMWHEMREKIIPLFPAAPKMPGEIRAYMQRVEDAYVTDAYHSLSIEGYRVSAELIERVRAGDWNPDNIQEDREQRNALAARGYYHAFQAVKKSVEKVLKGENAGNVTGRDHAEWYRELFSPSVTAGLIRAADLAGYRTGPVFIRNSRHVPPSREAVRDVMPLLFELLTQEQEPSVRIALGHFAFVYIHPYFDGNGRIGRFLMNVMLASGGYPWTVIPVERRNEYMEALEAASVDGNIEPCAKFFGGLVKDNLEAKPGPKVPEKYS
jgi:fido (protein-threonine AMPylation protein)